MYEVIGSKASRAFRVLWMLEELGVDYDHTPAGPRSAEAVAANPSGKIPALRVDGAVVTESVVLNGRTVSFETGAIARQANAALIVRDGEGITKYVSIKVAGAKSNASAAIIARSIANSPLVKTAIAGEDPNWGRIVMAVGKSGELADRDRLSIRFGDILVAEAGWVADSYSEAAGADYMKNPEIEISVDLGVGSGEAEVWTCDLTHEYIRINADYRS